MGPGNRRLRPRSAHSPCLFVAWTPDDNLRHRAHPRSSRTSRRLPFRLSPPRRGGVSWTVAVERRPPVARSSPRRRFPRPTMWSQRRRRCERFEPRCETRTDGTRSGCSDATAPGFQPGCFGMRRRCCTQTRCAWMGNGRGLEPSRLASLVRIPARRLPGEPGAYARTREPSLVVHAGRSRRLYVDRVVGRRRRARNQRNRRLFQHDVEFIGASRLGRRDWPGSRGEYHRGPRGLLDGGEYELGQLELHRGGGKHERRAAHGVRGTQ